MELEEILPIEEPKTGSNNRLVNSFTKIVHYMGNLSHEQLDALRINVKTVHWLQQRVEFDKIQYQEDPVPGAIFKVFSKNKDDLIIKSPKAFEALPDKALDYANAVWVKDIDQYIKGKQTLSQTAFEDLDDKLLHQTSENELSAPKEAMAGLFQAILPKKMYMTRQLSLNFYESSVKPFFVALAHREIAHRADHFAAKITGTTFGEYISSVKEVVDYSPVEQTVGNFLYSCEPSDKKREKNTAEIVQQAPEFRKQHGIPVYKSGL